MDDYQKYVQSVEDSEDISGRSGCGNFGCGTIVGIILGIAFLIFWYSHGGT